LDHPGLSYRESNLEKDSPDMLSFEHEREFLESILGFRKETHLKILIKK